MKWLAGWAAAPESGGSPRGSDPLPQPSLTIQRRVSSDGGIRVARQRIQVGFSHPGKTVTIQLTDTTLRVLDQHGELITTVPRRGTGV